MGCAKSKMAQPLLPKIDVNTEQKEGFIRAEEDHVKRKRYFFFCKNGQTICTVHELKEKAEEPTLQSVTTIGIPWRSR